MSKRTGPTNPILNEQISKLKELSYKNNSKFLKEISDKLNKPRRQRVEVNLAHIDRNTKENETIIVPGVVLGYGYLSKPVTIVAWKVSTPAVGKIKNSKSKTMTIDELIKTNPTGKNVKIMC